MLEYLRLLSGGTLAGTDKQDVQFRNFFHVPESETCFLLDRDFSSLLQENCLSAIRLFHLPKM